MSKTFQGFSDKDIEKIKNNSPDENVNNLKPKQRNKKTVIASNTLPDNNVEPIDDSARLFKPPKEMNSNDPPPTDSLIEISLDNKNDISPLEESNNDINSNRKQSIEDNILSKIADDILKFEKPVNMAEFQIQQKLIEEQNRKRKEMLAKALEDREKQTAEEAVRLEKIKKELQTLDAQLSGDVSILRKQIDKSCLAYSEAEKNYHKIEMEFLAAKMNLQKLKERKEMLTEHLCTLIAHNEARKAKKLEFLMDQLAYNKSDVSQSFTVCDGVCEQTGKMLEMEDEQVILRD